MKLLNAHVMILSIILFLFSGCTTPTSQSILSEPSIEFDGVYQSEIIEDEYWYYLRFYEDSTVITVSSTEMPTEIGPWFKKENITNYDFSHGYFDIKGSQLVFSVTSSYGTVDYEGMIKKDALTLSTYSHINNFQSNRIYTFVQLSEE